MLECLNPGDVIITSTLLNFSRYFEQSLKVVRFFYERGIRIITIEERFDSLEPVNIMESNLYFYFQMNRTKELSNGRQKRNDQREKRSGKRHLELKDFPFFGIYYDEWREHKITKTEFSKKLAVSRPKLDKLLHEYESEGNL